MRNYFSMITRNIFFRLSQGINFPLIPPDTLQLNFLYRCNLDCCMCTIKQHHGSPKLSLDVMKRLIDQAQEMKIREVLLLGGEPFLSDDFFMLVEHIKRRNMIAVVITNGTLLTQENLQKIKLLKLDHIVVSLDASCEEILSRIRGAGVFKRIKDNVACFQYFKRENPDFHTGISNCVTIMNQNIEDLYNIVVVSREMGFYDIVFQPVICNNTNQIVPGDISNTKIPQEKMKAMEASIDKIIDFKKESTENYDYIINSIRNLLLIKKYFSGTLKRTERECYVGFNRIQISQDAKMYFCSPIGDSNEVSFGDVSCDTLKDLWYSRRAREHRQAIRQNSCCCMQRCAYREEFERVEGIFEKFHYFKRLS